MPRPHPSPAVGPAPSAARPSATRRSVLVGTAGAAAGLGVATATTAPAAAGIPLAAAPVAAVLPPHQRHLVNRFSYGVTPALANAVRAAGGARQWFEKQLRPATIPDAAASAVRGWWPSLERGPAELWQRQMEAIEGGWEVMEDYKRWLLVRRILTNRQLHEVMTEFWQHHFNVPANGDPSFTHRVSYDAVVRHHALGRFEDLLHAVVTHPAMGIYLNNAQSSAAKPNENLGRELLELHTVGRGLYTEADVKSSARILTGWFVDMWWSWRAYYEPTRHYVGPVKVMGFVDPNLAPDGRALTQRYLRFLARHPATARRIARKLVVKFIRDEPPPLLVERLALVYLASGTSIPAVLRALVDSPEFALSQDAKVRDPGEDVVATYRVLGATLTRPPDGAAGDQHAANATLWQADAIGASPFSWQQPDGQPLDNTSWSSPSRLMNSLHVHYNLAGGWWPRDGITYRTPRQWLPSPTKRVRRRRRRRWVWVTVRVPLTFDYLVDHLSRLLLHRPATPALLASCSEAVGVAAREVVTPQHPLVTWMFPRLLTALLDSPTHMSR